MWTTPPSRHNREPEAKAIVLIQTPPPVRINPEPRPKAIVLIQTPLPVRINPEPKPKAIVLIQTPPLVRINPEPRPKAIVLIPTPLPVPNQPGAKAKGDRPDPDPAPRPNQPGAKGKGDRPGPDPAPRPNQPGAKAKGDRPGPDAPRPNQPGAAAGRDMSRPADAAPGTARNQPARTPSRVQANPDPTVRAAVENARTERNRARERVDAPTRRALVDRGVDRQVARQREMDLARRLDNDDDAKTILYSVLGGAAAGAIAGNLVSQDRDRYHRLPPEMVGRHPDDRRQSVDFLSRRFHGDAPWDEAPPVWRQNDYWDQHPPHYFDGNRRVVYYQTYESVPPILLASSRFDRVNVTTVAESPYQVNESAPYYHQNLPEAYRSDDAYAVSYEVDPDSAVILEDILFAQGSTDFADAYSYDLVGDLAESMNTSEIANERFVIEGHASAEGDYNANLQLSQERAERIARDLVAMGVAPERVVPVGYGEAEARYPDTSPEEERGLDRRVMVFRLNE
jgi:outer membrane protein OmpA-like peptidoglycan-associated protein